MDSNTPQLPPLETESRSMDSTTPQLRPSETESRSMDSTTQPNLNLQDEPYAWTSATKVRKEDGTIQLPPKFNLQEVKSMQSPPLGLKFTITPEFLAKYWSWRLERATGKPVAVGQPLGNKASTIPATSISIGPNYRKESIREDHLTLKFYFAKKKLIWEFLEGPLKEKIEVSWSDIIAIDAHIPDNQPGLLQIQLGNEPLFFRETPPKPGKHTIWEKTSDFTHAQAASRYGIHEAKFAPGVLEAHYPKLLLIDKRLLVLSMNPFPAYPIPTQQGEGESSTTAPCLPSQSLSLSSVNSPTPPSQSHPNLIPIPFTGGVGKGSFHMQAGERSRNANQYQTPLLMPSMSSQQPPFSLITGVEQSLLYNNPTPSMPASQYLNPAINIIGERSFDESASSSSRNADHHQTPLMLSTARAALESNIGEQCMWQELGSNNYFGSTGVTADPELDGDGNTGNDPMDLYSIIRSPNINRRPT